MSNDINHAKSNAWFLLSASSNGAVGGLWIIVPLYILSLGGSVIDVGITFSVFNFSQILSGIIWGYIIDRFHKRKVFLVFTHIIMSALILSLFFISEIYFIVVIFGLINFFFVGSHPVISLLLMETNPKTTWSRLYSRLRTLSHFGQLIGVVPGILLGILFEMREYFLILTSMSILSIFLAQLLVRDPSSPLRKKETTHKNYDLTYRLLHTNFHISSFFPKGGHKDIFRILRKHGRSRVSNRLPKLYIFDFLFFLGGAMFISSYLPFMKAEGLSEGNIFTISLVWIASPILFLPLVKNHIERNGEEGITQISIIFRLSAFVLSSLVVLSPLNIFPLSFFILSILGTTYAIVYSTSSTLLFKLLPGKGQGELLGIFSTVIGLGMLTGSLLSGFISLSFGFLITFAVAAIVMILALLSFHIFRRAVT